MRFDVAGQNAQIGTLQAYQTISYPGKQTDRSPHFRRLKTGNRRNVSQLFERMVGEGPACPQLFQKHYFTPAVNFLPARQYRMNTTPTAMARPSAISAAFAHLRATGLTFLPRVADGAIRTAMNTFRLTFGQTASPREPGILKDLVCWKWGSQRAVRVLALLL